MCEREQGCAIITIGAVILLVMVWSAIEYGWLPAN